LAEGVLEVVFGGVEGEVSDKQFSVHSRLYFYGADYSSQRVPDNRVFIPSRDIEDMPRF
jgi:hypothetical protein